MTGKKRVAAWVGGVVATLILLAVGITYVVVGVQGRDEVQSTIAREQIVGTPDMTPDAIRAEATKAGLDVATLDIPSCSVAGQTVDTGAEAKCFASYMRIHALESTGGQVYAEMGRYLDKNGKATSDEAKAAKDPQTGRPVENAARNLWVTETALATGLNMSWFAEQVSLFAIVVGISLIIIAIGLGVLTVFAFGLAPWRQEATATAPSGGAPAATA